MNLYIVKREIGELTFVIWLYDSIMITTLYCLAEKNTKRQLSPIFQHESDCPSKDEWFCKFDRVLIPILEKDTGVEVNGETNYIDFCFIEA